MGNRDTAKRDHRNAAIRRNLAKQTRSRTPHRHYAQIGQDLAGQGEERGPSSATERVDEISPRETSEVTSLKAMKEGAIVRTPNENTRNNSKGEKGPQEEEKLLNTSPQMDTAQHYLDDNFSDVMRSSVLGSNVSLLFNTTTFNTTQDEHKVTLDWVLPDGRNSQLETLKDKHITDFPAPGGTTGAMLVHLPHLEPFYYMKEFLVDLQSGELFVSLCNPWHPAGLTCKKRNFEVDSLMALIQHVSSKLRNRILWTKGTTNESPNGGFIENATATSTLHSKAGKLCIIQQTDVTNNEEKLY